VSVVSWVARGLEEGRFDGVVARGAARAWAWTAGRSVARPLLIPRRLHVVAVGGSTLGGSGKTPLALACVEALAARGARVALISHAYRASPETARVVREGDDMDLVGDEALACARELARRGVRASVVVAPRRQDAIDFAARGADALILDGVAQTTPVRASLALLAVDAHAPWGETERVPPLGDLRATKRALLDACDHVVAIGDAPLASLEAKPVHFVRVSSSGARLGGALHGWDELRRVRVGLVTSLARPGRIVRHLMRRGVFPTFVASLSDHTRPDARTLRKCRAARVDVFLASSKCAVSWSGLGDPGLGHPGLGPIAVIDYELAAPGTLALSPP
jgi:tetraacyldisaccharide 4'-kinase